MKVIYDDDGSGGDDGDFDHGSGSDDGNDGDKRWYSHKHQLLPNTCVYRLCTFSDKVTECLRFSIQISKISNFSIFRKKKSSIRMTLIYTTMYDTRTHYY